MNLVPRRVAALRRHAAARIAGGSAIFLLPQAVGSVLSQLGLVAIARIAGPAEFGELAAGIAVVGICATLADAGVSNRLLQEYSGREWDRQAVTLGLRLRLLLHAGASLIGALLVVAAPGSGAVIVGALLLALGPYAVVTNAYLVERLKGRWFTSSAWLAADSFVLSAGALAGLLVTREMIGAVFAVPVMLVGLAAIVPRQVRVRPGFVAPRQAASTLWSSRHFLVLAVAVAVYSRADRVVLQLLNGSSVTGQYAAAYNLLFGVALVGVALNAVLLAEFVQCRREQGQMRKAFRVSVLGSALLGTAIMAFALVLAPQIISLLYGAQYGDAVQLLRILSPLAVLYCVNPVTTTLLMARGQERVSARIAVMSVVLALICYPIGALTMGAAGAAIASVGIETVGGGLQMVVALGLLSPLHGAAQDHSVSQPE